MMGQLQFNAEEEKGEAATNFLSAEGRRSAWWCCGRKTAAASTLGNVRKTRGLVGQIGPQGWDGPDARRITGLEK
jgi:hypothetical protein